MDVDTNDLYEDEKTETTDEQIIKVYITKWFLLLNQVKENIKNFHCIESEFALLMETFSQSENQK
jgi:hypothetical protein